MLINSPNISGSLKVTGNTVITGSLTVLGGINATITGSATSASYVEYNNIANKPTLVSGSAQVSFNGITDKPTLVSGSSQVTYSGLTGIPSGIVSSSTQITGYNIFATTGSNHFNGSQAITGSLTVTGQVIAQTLNVQQVTSSIVYSSGSNVFGNSLANTQQFTGSVSVTGSLTVTGSGTFSGSVQSTGLLSRIQAAGSDGYIAYLTSGVQNTIMGFNNSGTTNAYGILNNYSYFGNLNAYGLQFTTNGGVVATITSGGFVGIGTTPSTFLHVLGSNTSARGQLSIQSNNSSNGAKATWYYDTTLQGEIGTTSGDFYALAVNNFLFYAGGAERMLITSAGVVQIGNDSNPYLEIANGGSTDVLSGIRWVIGSGRVNYGGMEMAASSADNGYIVFKTRNSGSTAERMRITSAGRVGIGTTDPQSNLEVRANDSTAYDATSDNGQDSNGSTITVRNGNTTTESFAQIDMQVSGDEGRAVGRIVTIRKGSATSDMAFVTENANTKAEKMRITSGGLVLVGTQSHTDGSMFQTSAASTSLNAYRQTTGDSGVMGFYSNQTSTKNVVAYIRCDGGLANYSANNLNLSDERTKNSIIPIESYWDKFKAIQIVKFKYNGQVHDDYNIGVIAQQIEMVAPEFVSNEGWGVDQNNKQDLKSIYESDLHHATIKVLQECMSKIEEQQSQIEILKSKIEILEQS
jgi:hypothetical protein